MDKIKRTLGFILSHPVGRRHPVRSICRFILWQLQSSFYPSKLFIKRFIAPVRYYARKGLTGITGNIYVGVHEFDDMMFLLHFLRPGDSFFDVGANVGGYTLLASGVCKADSITIEPVSSTMEILNKNMALNNLKGRVTTINSAAGAQAGVLSFTSNEDTTNHVATENESTQNNIVNVPVITIDSLIDKNQPSLIKIDVEGFETEVLRGMKATLDLSSLKAIIIELNGSGERYGYSEEQIHRLLLANKFKPYSYDPFKRLLTEAKTFGDMNTIYCRDMDFIARRLQTANGIKVMGEVI
jgi:FkbM family methyltransferase